MLIRSVVPRVTSRPVDLPRRGIDSLFGDFLNSPVSASGSRVAPFIPRVDVTDSEESMLFTAELPGIADGDFEVVLEGEVLTIKGEKSAVKVEESQRKLRSESAHGAFERSFQLAFEADPDSVSAALRNGVLTITVPKPESPRTRSIPISTS